MGVQQSKHSYVYKPKKKLRKKTIHNSVFVEKPEYLIYDDIHNNIDENAKYNTTKSCIDIRAIQKRKDQSRPLSLDEEMLDRPMSNISNVMHQYRQEVASEIVKVAPAINEILYSKNQGSSDGFKDVYDDDYYDNQMDSGDFKDAMSYHSLDLDAVRPTEVDGAVAKLNRSVEFEFERTGSCKKLGRRSSSRRVKDNTQTKQKPSDFQEDTSSKIEVEVTNSSNNISAKTILEPALVNLHRDVEAGTSSKTNLTPLQIAPMETIRQISTESSIGDPVTPKEIITLEDVTNILQGIKDKILYGEINDTEVYQQLLMCKKKARSIHVTSIKIRAKKTMLIGKINKFIHWFAVSEPEIPNTEEAKMVDNDEDEKSIKNHYETESKVSEDIEVVPNSKQFDARTIFIVNTMQEQDEIADTKENTNPFITSSSNSDMIYENSPKICETVNNLINYNFNKDNSDGKEDQQINVNNNSIEQEDQQIIDNIDDGSFELEDRRINDNVDDESIEQKDQQNIPSVLLLNVYEEISNIRLLLQEVHSKMDDFTGMRYDIEYHNIIDEVFQARIMLNNVKGTELLEASIIRDYEKFFEDLLLYFEEIVDRNERPYEDVIEPDPETVDGRKTVCFETQGSLSDSEYYTNVKNQVNFDFKSETSTNLSESDQDDNNTHFVSLTEYDGKVINTCEAFNKTIELQDDDADDEADLSPDDDFIYKTNAVGQIVFEHEESQKPYIVDPISFSKCRMRPLSIIQEHLDELYDCHYSENIQETSKIHDAGQESEDRDDWDSFDENVANNEQLNHGSLEKDDETREFEEMERYIDNIRTNSPDGVINNEYVEGGNKSLEEEIQINGEIEEEYQNYDNIKGWCLNENTIEGREENTDDFQEILTERYVNVNEVLLGQSKSLELDFEHAETNNYYSLESMLPDDKSTKDITEQSNFPVENEMVISSNNDVHQEEFLQPPTENNSLDQPNSQTNEDILNPINYNFGTTELKSYNEIMKINSIIDNLQSQIDHFTGTKSSPEYMSTFKQIFDNMRVLNNIDNCDYQEDILNLIDYTSDKIQKCIFELDLKVS